MKPPEGMQVELFPASPGSPVAEGVVRFTQAILDNMTPVLQAVQDVFTSLANALGPDALERIRRWQHMDPATREAVDTLWDGVEDAEVIYADLLGELRRDLTGHRDFGRKLAAEAQIGYGVTQEQVMDSCVAVFQMRHLLDFTQDEAAAVAAAALEGYSRRVQR